MHTVLLVARYKEDLTWINSVPACIDVVIYNKGPRLTQKFARPASMLDVENVGRESDTYLRYVHDNYDRLPDALVCLQGDPLPHCHNLHASLKNISRLMQRHTQYPVVPLTNGYNVGKGIPPPLVEHCHHTLLPLDAGRVFIDTHYTTTLNSTVYNDPGTWIHRDYLRHHGLKPGTNIVHHFLDLAGLGHLVPRETETFRMFYAAQFCVRRAQLLAHPRETYLKMIRLNNAAPVHGYMMEQVWMTLFGGAEQLDRLPHRRSASTYRAPAAQREVHVEPTNKPLPNLNDAPTWWKIRHFGRHGVQQL